VCANSTLSATEIIPKAKKCVNASSPSSFFPQEQQTYPELSVALTNFSWEHSTTLFWVVCRWSGGRLLT